MTPGHPRIRTSVPEGLVEEPAAPPEDDERDTEDVGRRDQGQERDEAERPAEPAGTARHREGDGEPDGDGQERDDAGENEAVSKREQEVGRVEELGVMGQRQPGVALEARHQYAQHGQRDEDEESPREAQAERGGETCVGERGQARLSRPADSSRASAPSGTGPLLRASLVAELLPPGADDLGADLLLAVELPVDRDELRPRRDRAGSSPRGPRGSRRSPGTPGTPGSRRDRSSSWRRRGPSSPSGSRSTARWRRCPRRARRSGPAPAS